MTVGPFDEPIPLGESEYGGENLGLAGDLGASHGRVLRPHDKRGIVARSGENGVDPVTGLGVEDAFQ